MSSKGKINVQIENIFPVIKKFLYSDTDIFLREIVSNAVDAVQKLKTLTSSGEYKGELTKPKVEVILDEENKTITVRDNGLGMTEEEIVKYINEIAFSGAEEFVQKYKESTDNNAIIGHFGLGFYSSFMVSSKVEIITKSYKENSQAVKWSSEGDPNYEIEEIVKDEIGTDIVMYINDDSKEYVDKTKLSSILNKYCKYLPVDIIFGKKDKFIDNPKGEKDENGNVKQDKVEIDNIINNKNPLWKKKPSELKNEDYTDFYQELYPMSEESMFNIHLNVDHPFNLTGVLYFPKLKNNVQIQKNKIQLFSNQVFITDSVENIVPEFMQLLHGVIDSPDIPLNVSRSYLQADSNVKKISKYITKKVSDKLSAMIKNEREDYETKWDNINVFVEYGILTDEKFAEKAMEFLLFKDTEGKYYSVKEYEDKISSNQTDKDDKKVILYTNNPENHHNLIQKATEKAYNVIVLESPLAPHFVQHIEMKMEKIQFARLDADSIENLIKKDVEIPSKLDDKQKEDLKKLIEETINDKKYTIDIQSLEESNDPFMITESEFIRRMKEQQEMGGNSGMFGHFPEMYNLVVNSNHQLITTILDSKKPDKKNKLISQSFDLALLSKGMLKGEKLTEFMKRSIELIK